MCNDELVSVLMPCYNHAKYVEESIESILNQTYTNIELLIVENGSTDNSRQVLQKYADNPKVRLFYLDKNDCEKAHDILSDEARGNYFAQATSDDIWMKDKLEKQMEFLLNNPDVDVCTAWAKYCDENMVPKNGVFDEIFAVSFDNSAALLRHMWDKGNCICAPSGVGKREAYDMALYRKPIAYWQLNDYEGWLILLLNGMNIHILPEVLVHMREHGSAISFSGGSVARSIQENASLSLAIIENISDEMFLDAFSDQIIKENINSHEDIMCEKLLLLLRYARYVKREFNMLVPEYFYKYYPEIKDYIKDEYNLDRSYFMEQMENIGYMAIAKYYYEDGYKAALEKNS